MDTQEVAAKLGTTPRVLRQFLRSPYSTFLAVGSGARYDFSERDLPTLTKRFSDWQGAGKPKPPSSIPPKAPAKSKADIQQEADEREWDEEGSIVLEDIRDPEVRRRVKADAKAAEDRLMMLLVSLGMHVSQRSGRR